MTHFWLALFCAILLFQNTAWSLCVTANEANLRAEPSSNGKLLWKVGKYMPLLAVEQKGSWLLVKDLEGKKMWIYGSLVSDEIDCAVIKVGKAVLRKGPGKENPYTPLTVAHKYSPFKKLERDGAWLHLEDDYGFKHWVFENNLWEPLEYTSVTY